MKTHLPRRASTGLTIAALLVSGCTSASNLTTPDDEPQADETASTPSEDPSEVPTAEAPVQEPTVKEPPPAPPVRRPSVGGCVRLGTSDVFVDGRVGLPEKSRCRGASGQYASVSDLTPAMRRAATSPDADALWSLTSTRCRRDVIGWLDTDNEGLEISQFEILATVPKTDEIAAGANFFACTTYVIKRRNVLLPLTRSTEGILDTRRGRDYDSCARAAITNAGNATQVCSIRHNWRAVAAARMGEPEDRYPGDERLRTRMQGVCEVAVGDYVNATGTYEYGYTWPTRETWSGDDRFGLCYAKTPD